MAQPIENQGSGLTRSEAAIEAWKKRERAKPQDGNSRIANRVREILAKNRKKGKGNPAPKGRAVDPEKARAKAERAREIAANKEQRTKERVARAMERTTQQAKREGERVAAAQAKQQRMKRAAPAKERATEESPSKEKQAESRAKVASEMAESDTGLSPSGSAALTAFADGANLPKEMSAELTTMGLLEADTTGGHRLSYAGRATVNAMNRGDTRAALDAISRGADRTKAKEDRETARAARETERVKAKAERAKAQAERTAKEDASRARVEAARIEAANKRNRKAIDMSDIELDDPAIKAGARHSRGDTDHLNQATAHLHAAGATCPDCADDEDDEEELDDAAEKAIKSIQDNPQWYAQHECGDVAQAAGALSTLAMLIQSELAEADEDAAHITMLCDAARLLVRFIGAELDELEGAAGDAADSARHGPMKGIELITPDDGESVAVMGGTAIKAIGSDGWTNGYLVKFGGDGDLSQFRDVFTNATNFGKHTKSDVWVHHRMLPGLGKKQLTNQAEIGIDDEGVFIKHLLDLRSSYEAKLYGLVQDGKLGWSSGTAPHLVERKALGDGRHEITQWTLGLDASYTPMPAGGFVVNAGAMKSLLHDAGIDLLNAMYIDDSPEAIKSDSARRDGVKADDERARRLLLESELLELEATAL